MAVLSSMSFTAPDGLSSGAFFCQINMQIRIFSRSVELMLSTSPVPGKPSASIVDSSQTMWPDVVRWDPMTGYVECDPEKLSALIQREKRKQSPVVSGLAGGVDALTSIFRSVLDYFWRHFTQSHGIANIAFALVLSGMVAVVALPLMGLSGLIQAALARQVQSEARSVIDQAGEFFRDIKA